MLSKRKRLLLLVVLSLILSLALYFFINKKRKDIHFVVQGQTVLHAGNIGMKIWDNNTEDGDTVAVYLNDKLIADSVAILYEPVLIPLGRLSRGEYLLGVRAINMGMVAPASASISLTDEKGTQEFIMDARMESPAGWKIIIP